MWIKKKIIIHANEIEENFLKKVTISEFDNNFNLIQIITSEKVDIKSNNWLLSKAKFVSDNFSNDIENSTIYTNFNYQLLYHCH